MAIERGAAAVVSGEAARTTPPASAARNLDGIVSRCLASSACSKVPRKAIKAPPGHAGPSSRRRRRVLGSRVLVSRAEAEDPGGWVGGALPPGSSLHALPTITHSLPQCNPFP